MIKPLHLEKARIAMLTRNHVVRPHAAPARSFKLSGVISPPIDRRFPKRHPEIGAMYPGHFLPSSPQMLEELLRRSLPLERSLMQQPLIVSRAA